MKNGRNTAGQFTEGNSGKPKGSRNKATIAIESLLEGQAEELTQTAISKALDGDSMALRLCMDRIAPLPKDNTISFPLPDMENANDASKVTTFVTTQGKYTSVIEKKQIQLKSNFFLIKYEIKAIKFN